MVKFVVDLGEWAQTTEPLYQPLNAIDLLETPGTEAPTNIIRR